MRAFGGRGFSILDLGERRVFESGDDIESHSRRQPDTFNGACSGNGTITPESEADVTSAEYVRYYEKSKKKGNPVEMCCLVIHLCVCVCTCVRVFV